MFLDLERRLAQVLDDQSGADGGVLLGPTQTEMARAGSCGPSPGRMVPACDPVGMREFVASASR